jgi:chemotaxis methyl-accepting protein methylase
MSPIVLLSSGWQWAQRRLMSVTAQSGAVAKGRIPITTRLFRNMPLLSEVFALMGAARLPQARLFFRACGGGEEPYSLGMQNLSGPMMAIDVVAADYVPQVLAIARRAKYSRPVVDELNSGFIPIGHRKYFEDKFLRLRNSCAP